MELVNEPHSTDALGAERTQYLSFSLADGEYAVNILHVREIRGLGPITPLPNAPLEMRGVMNLRGAVVPVIDLRTALGLPAAEYNKFTVIVVLSVRDRTMGFVVDSVCDVISVQPSEVESTSELGQRIEDSSVGGIARVQDRFVVLLDIDRVAAGHLGEGVAA